MDGQEKYNHIFQIAESQGGYFTTDQAEVSGYSRANLHYHVKNGKFTHVTKAVYRITNFPITLYEDLFIALLKAGPRSALSHQTALSVYALSDFLPGEVHVTLPRTASRRREGIRYHTKSITEDEITRCEGLRVTTVERALVDLFESGFNPQQLRLAAGQSFDRGLTTPMRLAQALDKRGASSLKEFETLLGIHLQ